MTSAQLASLHSRLHGLTTAGQHYILSLQHNENCGTVYCYYVPCCAVTSIALLHSLFTMRHYAGAVYAVIVCLTLQYCIKMAKNRIMQAKQHRDLTVF